MSSSPFPAVHSVLAQGALAEVLRAQYDCGPDLKVQLLRRNIGDTYLVTGLGEHKRAILRVYRAGWRTKAEVDWELQFIHHLAQKGLSVSRPIARRDGAFFGMLPAAEGPRFFVLFEYLSGRALQNNPTEAALYGTLAAQLHLAAADFEQAGRFALDLDHLIWQPMACLRPLLADFPEQQQALEGFAKKTDARLRELAPDLTWGACHGDLHEINVRIQEGQLSLFDFDCGGPGFQAYDLAVYWWSQVTHGDPAKAQPIWDAYLAAYRALRPLTDADLQAIPHFVMARGLWFMGLMASRVNEFGSETLGQPFFDFGVNFMRGWQEQHGLVNLR